MKSKNASPASSLPELSLVMPCFNEASGLEALLETWLVGLRERIESFEVLVINDGSSDGSGRILDRMRKENRELRVFHQLNVGHGPSIRRGYELARGQYVAQADLNGCFEVSDFLRMWDLRDKYALVLGRRTHRIDSWANRQAARLSRRTVRWLFDMELLDPDVPFRIMNGLVLRKFLRQLPKSQSSPNLALSVFFRLIGQASVFEMPVPFRFRSFGKSRSGLISNLSASGTVLAELLRLKLASVRNKLELD